MPFPLYVFVSCCFHLLFFSTFLEFFTHNLCSLHPFHYHHRSIVRKPISQSYNSCIATLPVFKAWRYICNHFFQRVRRQIRRQKPSCVGLFFLCFSNQLINFSFYCLCFLLCSSNSSFIYQRRHKTFEQSFSFIFISLKLSAEYIFPHTLKKSEARNLKYETFISSFYLFRNSNFGFRI